MSRTYIQRVSKELSHTIYYRFTCEQCGKDSNWLPLTITGTGICEGGNIKLTPAGEVSDETNRQVLRDAQEMLSVSMQNCRKKAGKNVFLFSGKCSDCGKPQSWQVKGGQLKSIGTGLSAALIAAVFIMLGRYLFKLPVSDEAHVIITAAAFMITLTVLLIRRISMKIQTKDVKNKQKPEINWNYWNFEQ